MPLNIKKMASKVNDTTLEFAGEEVSITYRSGIITAEWEAQYKGQEDGLFHQVHDLVVTWDLEGDKPGKSFPTEVKDLRTLPIEFLAAVVKACADDLVPNRKTSGRSGGSSFGE